MLRAKIIVAATIATSLVAVLVPAQASPVGLSSETHAKPKRPTLSIEFLKADVSAGTALSLTYAAKKVPDGAKLQVQRKFGESWRKVKTLRQRADTITLPGVPQGAYPYRLATVERGQTTFTSKTKEVRSYSSVAGTTLLAGNTSGSYEAWQPSSTQIGSTLFSYEFKTIAGGPVPYLKIENASCRSLHLAGGSPLAVLRLEVVQSAADLQGIDIPANTVGALDVAVPVGSNVQVQASSVQFGGYGTVSGDCYTRTGHR